jgi:23S rRNA (cytidine1920-2'-O)/16S rRNA (cytidine1409-2'-O)-methyltransferase
MRKIRLDLYLVEQGLAETRSLAQRMIMSGSVRINGQVALKPAISVSEGDKVTIDQPPAFVSRGGEKLKGALTAFNLENLDGFTCVDVGASTGGFTDCLLQHGAGKVYAVDVGYGILHWKLRQDPRVVVMEKTNARFVNSFPEKIELVTIDASFISLRTLLPVVRSWFADGKGEIIALIKPQFEAGRKDAARGEGVIRDPEIHKRILLEVLEFAIELKFGILGLIQSPLVGPKGNIEFLIHLSINPVRENINEDWIGNLFPEIAE